MIVSVCRFQRLLLWCNEVPNYTKQFPQDIPVQQMSCAIDKLIFKSDVCIFMWLHLSILGNNKLGGGGRIVQFGGGVGEMYYRARPPEPVWEASERGIGLVCASPL